MAPGDTEHAGDAVAHLDVTVGGVSLAVGGGDVEREHRLPGVEEFGPAFGIPDGLEHGDDGAVVERPELVDGDPTDGRVLADDPFGREFRAGFEHP